MLQCILYCALLVSCPVERVGSGSEVLYSVRVQVTKAFSLYSDIARCLSLLLDYQSAKHITKYSLLMMCKLNGDCIVQAIG